MPTYPSVRAGTRILGRPEILTRTGCLSEHRCRSFTRASGLIGLGNSDGVACHNIISAIDQSTSDAGVSLRLFFGNRDYGRDALLGTQDRALEETIRGGDHRCRRMLGDAVGGVGTCMEGPYGCLVIWRRCGGSRSRIGEGDGLDDVPLMLK